MQTTQEEYTRRLVALQAVWWKRWLDVQAPYRWNLRRLKPGLVLEIGCGIGRNLAHLGGRGVGIDHNPFSVRVARERGLEAHTPEEFVATPWGGPPRFDSILLSHVAEHMHEAEVVALLRDYVPRLKREGRIILITPQERGFRHDPTHVQFMDFDLLRRIVEAVGFETEREYSFPFPRALGRLFVYNEFVSVSRRRAGSGGSAPSGA